MIGAEGCDGYSSDETNPKVGRNGPLCIDEESNVWLIGLAFLAIGGLTGSVLTILISSALMKRRYWCCGGASGANHTRVPTSQLQLPEIDTAMDDEDGII